MDRLTFNAAMEQFYREFPRTVPWDELPEDLG